MKSYIAHLDYFVPKARITLSDTLADEGLSERDLAKISEKLLGMRGKGGHLGDVDLIRNLKDISSKQEFPNSYLVVYGVATGTSWNALLLKTCPPAAETATSCREETASAV